jgi:hypothetical protein
MAVGLVLVASAGFAGVNYKVQAASHPDDFKTFDTAKIRERFVMEKVMSPDEINLTYTMYDRLVYGGAMPVTKALDLESFLELKAENFLDRRELGVINVGGSGALSPDSRAYPGWTLGRGLRYRRRVRVPLLACGGLCTRHRAARRWRLARTIKVTASRIPVCVMLTRIER